MDWDTWERGATTVVLAVPVLILGGQIALGVGLAPRRGLERALGMSIAMTSWSPSAPTCCCG